MPQTSNKTIILYNNVAPYFFTALPDTAFPVRKKGRFSLLLYRLFRWMKSPAISVSYGRWKEKLSDVSTVVILDSTFDHALKDNIKKKNPDAEVILLFWNPIKKEQLAILGSFYDKSHTLTYLLDDAKKYGIGYCPSFYSKDFAEEVNVTSSCPDIIFLGRDKDRLSFLSKLATTFEDAGFDASIMVLDPSSRDAKGIKPIDGFLPYEEYCSLVKGCKAVLDISQPGVHALNLRVMESLFFQKKLITTNGDIRELPFYTPLNILVIDNDGIDPEELIAFMETPFQPYDQDVLNQFEMTKRLEAL